MVKVCPVCWNRVDAFLPKFGREGVLCPHCSTFERHRHQRLVVESFGLFARILGKRVLHCGPNDRMAHDLEDRAALYVGLDVKLNPNVTVQADLTAAPFADESFDFIWCSHVLEHIRDVDMALLELKRILAPTGAALLDVPLDEGATSLNAEAENHGHWWRPGEDDWFEKYHEAGFKVTMAPADKFDKGKYGLNNRGPLAVCEK